MVINELYINGKLVVLPRDFSIRLNKQLLNPAELNNKNAQFSYAISLPPVASVHEALNYANIEETRDKFNKIHTATYIANGVLIFEGLLRLTVINDAGYKGNLYKPAAKTVKDIFGDIPLNQLPELRIPFTDFAASITTINESARTANLIAIFPFALYGVLPKVPLNRDANNYSGRTVWDNTVYIGMQDIPPSLNLMQVIAHMFESQGYGIQGTAFDDEKLARIYMSYKNAAEYVQPWNYGYHAKMRLNGEWSSYQNARVGGDNLEKSVNQSYDAEGFAVYSTNLLDAVNARVTVTEDLGGNILYKEIQDQQGAVWAQGQIRIPVSGFYKVNLNASITIDQRENITATNSATGVQHMSGRSSQTSNDFYNNSYEIKLLRDRRQGDFGLSGAKIDGRFYYDNLPQNALFDADNVPKYFPQVTADGQKVLVDSAQNKNVLLGFHFGKGAQAGRANVTPFINPQDSSQMVPMILAAKPALSWNTQEDTDRALLALPNSGYWKYGRVNVFGDDEDNPNLNIDYSSGTRVTGQVLDTDGNPQPPAADNLGVRFNDYYINSITGFMQPLAGWEASDYIDLLTFTDVRFSATVPPSEEAAVVAFFDVNLQFIGYGVLADPVNPTAYTSEPITPPALARYARFSAELASLTITGVNVVSENVILNRFPLDRYFTYRLEAPTTVTGKVYIHNGTETSPVFSVDFVNGVAEFNTNLYPINNFQPRLTLYLKTVDYDIDGVLTINRIIDEQSDDTIDWELTNRYRIILNNAPANYVRRGQYDGGGANANWDGQGDVSAVIWLEAGELLSVASVTGEGRRRRSAQHSTHGWVNHRIKWSLSIQPFRIDKDWLKVSLQGNGTAAMNWNDPVNFDTDSINLMGFLSADMKANEFIDNVVKAFNLELTPLDGNNFALNVKQSRRSISSRSLDIDRTASVNDRENTPLGLPSGYRLGFTVATDEEGYVTTQDDGGGQYSTGSNEGDIVEQKSSFSYNWFKVIQKEGVALPLPIISKADVWAPTMPYPDAMAKRYTDLAYRFWYFDGLLNDLGASFEFNGMDIGLAKVSNEINGVSILNYRNEPHTLLDNYFTLLINGSSHYTEVEMYLTPLEYQQLDGTIHVRFNGDLYFIAEVSGYDPTNRNKAKLKLIRRI